MGVTDKSVVYQVSIPRSVQEVGTRFLLSRYREHTLSSQRTLSFLPMWVL